MEPTREDWIRLAAFIDGEGCIEIYVGKPRNKTGTKDYRMTVKVSNTDRRMPEWCQRVFGGHIENPRAKTRPASHKPLFDWCIERSQAAFVLMGCLNFFVIKREQAEVALKYAATVQSRGAGKLSSAVMAYRDDLVRQLMVLKNSRRNRGAIKTKILAAGGQREN